MWQNCKGRKEYSFCIIPRPPQPHFSHLESGCQALSAPLYHYPALASSSCHGNRITSSLLLFLTNYSKEWNVMTSAYLPFSAEFLWKLHVRKSRFMNSQGSALSFVGNSCQKSNPLFSEAMCDLVLQLWEPLTFAGWVPCSLWLWMYLFSQWERSKCSFNTKFIPALCHITLFNNNSQKEKENTI